MLAFNCKNKERASDLIADVMYIKMSKANEFGLNEVAISLAALKQSRVGDELVLLGTNGQVSWCELVSLTAQRGCKGGTTVTLRDVTLAEEVTLTVRSDLPEGIARIRRIGPGINVRTLRKAQGSVVAQPVYPVQQPEGEFENILDVPEEPLCLVGDEAPAAAQSEELAIAAQG